MTSLRWTRRLQAAVDRVLALERDFVPGRDGRSAIEVAKVDLADAVLAAAELQDLPRANPARVMTVRRPPQTKKRRRA
jgi:hypothetical protein